MDPEDPVEALIRSAQWADAERTNREVLEAAPQDVRTLNRAGLIAEQRGRTDEAIAYSERVLELSADERARKIAVNRLGRLKTPPAAPVAARMKLRAGTEPNADVSFTAAEAFPHVERSIDRQYHQATHPWVDWREIQQGMLADPVARDDIETWARKKGRTPEQTAKDVQTLWSRMFTVPHHLDPPARYEPRDDGNAYRPRRL